MPDLQAPPASADPSEHADWLELTALLAPDRDSSAQDLITAIRRAGSADVMIEDDGDVDHRLDEAVEQESERLEEVAESALDRLAARQDYLAESYPFTLNGALEAKPDAVASSYAFLSVVSSFGWSNDDPPESAASLFEQVSAAALVAYLGGPETVRSYDFGFPRRDGPASFFDAVEDLCRAMGEGIGCGVSRRDAAQVKDAKLDLVVWVPFGDGRSNQFSVFGQCATGANWRAKINELQPVAFCKTWLKEQPAVNPSLAFFVPREIEERHWREAANSDRRLVFDRLRIAHLLDEMDADLARRCAEWTESALR